MNRLGSLTRRFVLGIGLLASTMSLGAQHRLDYVTSNDSLQHEIVEKSGGYIFENVSSIEDSLFARSLDESGQELFHEITSDVLENFTPDAERSKSEAIRYFSTVDSVVEANGVDIINGLSGSINEELSSPRPDFDCDLMALVYSTISRDLPFDVKFSFLPGPHVITRYMIDDSTYVNWDANVNEHISDNEYRNKHFNLEEMSESWFDYLETVDSKQALSMVFYNEASRLLSEGTTETAKSYFDIASSLLPDFPLYVKRLLKAYGEDEDVASLDSAASKVIDIDSSLYVGYFYKGVAFSQKQQSDSALHYFSEAIERKSDFGKLYYKRGVEYLKADDYPAAERDFETLNSLGNTWYNHDYIVSFRKRLNEYESFSSEK